MSDHENTDPWATVDWHALAKRHHQIQAGMLHGINGETKSELYGADFDTEVLRKAITGYYDVHGGSTLVPSAEAQRTAEKARATGEFELEQAQRVLHEAHQAATRDRRRDFQDLADSLRLTAHSAGGKYRTEGYLLACDRIAPARKDGAA